MQKPKQKYTPPPMVDLMALQNSQKNKDQSQSEADRMLGRKLIDAERNRKFR